MVGAARLWAPVEKAMVTMMAGMKVAVLRREGG